jgi:23S rRNA G2445 N2-methylase RlmL
MVTVLARCVRGLEWVAADEITQRFPEARSVTLAPREITFGLPDLTPALADLRTVDDVFVRVGEVGEVGSTRDVPTWLARALAELDWATWFGRLRDLGGLPAAPTFDVVASLDGQRSFNRFDVENTIGALLPPQLGGGSFLARTGEARAGDTRVAHARATQARGTQARGTQARGTQARGTQARATDTDATSTSGDDRPPAPQLSVRVLLRGPQAVAALRLAPRPLHRRPYKQATGPGTLHPPAAAALTRIAAPRPRDRVLDPFCGDGTIVIEAALSVAGVRATGTDIDPERVAHARANAARAGVIVDLQEADAGGSSRTALHPGAARLVTNPPWNLAVDARGLLRHSLDGFWRRLPGLLEPEGCAVLLTDVALDVPTQLERLGYRMSLASQIRLAGRISHLILCAPGHAPAINPGLRQWRDRAAAEGVVTDDGF